MATKEKQPKKTDEPRVTRISASESGKKSAKEAPAKVVKAEKTDKKDRKNPFMAFLGYFGGAWYELKQVRWPTRRAAWGMTMAVLAFTAVFIVIILLLDALFKYLFQLILG